MSEDQDRLALAEMFSAVLRDMQPHVVEAKQAAAHARRELRDRFAMAALTGLLSCSQSPPYTQYEDFAESAYDYADAMLKARGND